MATKIARKITGYSVTTPEAQSTAPSTPLTAFTNEADRKICLDAVPPLDVSDPRWEHRPDLPDGHDGHTYRVRGPERTFYVCVNHAQNGHAEPFEVFTMGEAPRGMSVLAKSLSMDMRSRDRKFLKRKLAALLRTTGDRFDMVMPDGRLHNVKSETAAFAELVTWRCTELGVFTTDGPTPLLDALMSKREPKTTSAGGVAHYWDIANQATGDDFTLFVKELVLRSGECRPFSVWMSGEYPRSLDGLCKALSYDLRVVNIEWGARKLQQLLDVEEPQGSFFAEVPGTEKKTVYPSTVAYVAALLLHRLHVLGLVGSDGRVAAPTGAVQLHAVESEPEAATAEPKGLLCEACGAYAVKVDGGCGTCQACGFSHCS